MCEQLLYDKLMLLLKEEEEEEKNSSKKLVPLPFKIHFMDDIKLISETQRTKFNNAEMNIYPHSIHIMNDKHKVEFIAKGTIDWKFLFVYDELTDTWKAKNHLFPQDGYMYKIVFDS